MIYRYIIKGRVQGVGFRYHILKEAEKTGILGFVKNLPDGSVEIIAQASKIEIEDFETFIKKSPGHSIVEDIKKSEPEKHEILTDFKILY